MYILVYWEIRVIKIQYLVPKTANEISKCVRKRDGDKRTEYGFLVIISIYVHVQSIFPKFRKCTTAI